MIYVVRHGKTDGGQKGNVPLNEIGIEQSRMVAPRVTELGIDKIYSSDVVRARQTTEIVNAVVGVDVIYDPRLREFSIIAEHPIKNLDNLTQAEQEKYNELIKQSFKDAFDRVQSFLSELRANKVDNVAVITHRGIISTIGYCLEHDTFDFCKFDENRKKYKRGTENCSITKFELY
ncbi:MAG: histidine phosphatase family protein [Firmicutes bacterium]|nr:histidine phosphatase family protein [Bacillota bacterium]